MTPKATELLDKTLTTHAARVCADPSEPAKSLILAGEASAAYTALAAYIESLEQRIPRAKQWEIPEAVEAFLKKQGREGVFTGSILDHVRRRWPLTTGQNLGNFLRLLEGEGRAARVRKGKWRAATPPPPSAPPSLSP